MPEPRFSVGQQVVVERETHGWGLVQLGDCGVVRLVEVYPSCINYYVDFPNHSSWQGHEECFRPAYPTPEEYPGVLPPADYLFKRGDVVFDPDSCREGTLVTTFPPRIFQYRAVHDISELSQLHLVKEGPEYPPCPHDVALGDKVMVMDASYGWGRVTPGMTGKVIANDTHAGIRVSLKHIGGWNFHTSDLALVEKYTGTRSKEIKQKGVEDMAQEERRLGIEVMKEKIWSLRDLPTGSISAVIMDGLIGKHKLNAILGHSHVNQFRTVIDLPTDENDWMDDHTNNRIKQMIARYMKWFLEDMQCHKNEYIDERKNSRRITRLVLAELQRWDYHPLKDFFINELGWKEHTFGQKLGEVMARRASKDVLVLSTNFFDFLTSSGDHWGLAAYGSCHGFSGCHFNGNIAYWNDDFTLIAYVAPRDRLDYKIGRSWVYLPEPRTVIVEAKSYGTFPSVMRKRMREHLERKLDDFSGFSGVWRKRSVSYSEIEGPGVNYFDHGGVDIAYTTHAYPDGLSSDQYPRLRFAEATCLECGDATQHCEGGLCEGCSDRGYRCDCCDERMHEDDVYYNENGTPYCRSCYNDRYSRCECCDGEMRRDDVYYYNDYPYCEDCFYERYFYCQKCGEATDNDERVEVDGNEYCEYCAERKGYVKCDHCGEWSDECEEVQDVSDTVCPKCAERYYSRCEACGDLYASLKEHSDGSQYCEDCFEKAEVELDEAA